MFFNFRTHRLSFISWKEMKLFSLCTGVSGPGSSIKSTHSQEIDKLITVCNKYFTVGPKFLVAILIKNKKKKLKPNLCLTF